MRTFTGVQHTWAGWVGKVNQRGETNLVFIFSYLGKKKHVRSHQLFVMKFSLEISVRSSESGKTATLQSAPKISHPSKEKNHSNENL